MRQSLFYPVCRGAPLSGLVGATVIISGTNFNTLSANNIVFFGATMERKADKPSALARIINPSVVTE